MKIENAMLHKKKTIWTLITILGSQY